MNRRIRLNGWSILALFMVLVLSLTFVGKITSGFENWEADTWQLRDRNPDNLLSGEFEDYNRGEGITVSSYNDGTLLVKGEYQGTGDSLVVDIEELTLSAGTYCLSGAPNGGNYTYHLRVSYGSGNTVIGDFGVEEGVFTLTGSTSVQVQLVIFPDQEFNNLKIRPVLVEGDEPGEFYK